MHGDLITVFDAQLPPETFGLPENAGTVIPGSDAHGQLPHLRVPEPRSPNAGNGNGDGAADPRKSSLAAIFGRTEGFDPHSSTDRRGVDRKESVGGQWSELVETLHEHFDGSAQHGHGAKEIKARLEGFERSLEGMERNLEGMREVVGLIADKVGVTEGEEEMEEGAGSGDGASEESEDELMGRGSRNLSRSVSFSLKSERSGRSGGVR